MKENLMSVSPKQEVRERLTLHDYINILTNLEVALKYEGFQHVREIIQKKPIPKVEEYIQSLETSHDSVATLQDAQYALEHQRPMVKILNDYIDIINLTQDEQVLASALNNAKQFLAPNRNIFN